MTDSSLPISLNKFTNDAFGSTHDSAADKAEPEKRKPLKVKSIKKAAVYLVNVK